MWKSLGEHLRHFGKRIEHVQGDGYCYIRAIIKVLSVDYRQQHKLADILRRIEDQLFERLDYYCKWHPASKRDIVRDTYKFLRTGKYYIDIMDVIIAATADALQIRLKIFTKHQDHLFIITHESPLFTGTTIFLKYFGDHYDAIVDVVMPEESGLQNLSVPSTQEDLSDFQIDGRQQKTLRDKKMATATSYVAQYVDNANMYDSDNCSPNELDDFDLDKHIHIATKPNKEDVRIKVQDAITGREEPKRFAKRHLNMWKFKGKEPEEVDEIPFKINGTQVFKMRGVSEDFMKTVRDGRWWRYSPSSRVGFTGERRFGACVGSRACPNVECLKVQNEGIVNISDFARDKKHKERYTCGICGHYAVQVYCGCYKVVEYNPDTQDVCVMHEGQHICNPRSDDNKKISFVEKHLDVTMGRTPEETSTNLILFALCTGTVEDAEAAADMTINKRLIAKLHRNKPMAGQEFRTEPEAQGFQRLVKVRDQLKAVDNFRIYRMNSREINGEPSYVFKSSRQAADLMLSMDIDSPREHVLQKEFAYMDGMHSRCAKYTTLTLWTYHPAMRKLQALAIMECEKEDSQNISHFYRLINKMLQEHTGRSKYTFNPVGIIVDEGGANWKAVRDVFGKEMAKRVVGCQWHFLNCARRQLMHVKHDDRKSFEQHYRDIVHAHTDKEYLRIYNAMYLILERASKTTWLNWWDIRKYHIVPCYRGYEMPSLNLAETGHSKLQKMGKKLKLSVACMRDVAMFMKQRAEYTAFMNSEKTNIGKGPTQKEHAKKQDAKDDKLVSDFMDVIRDEDFLREFEDEDDSFMPEKSAKHRYRSHVNNPLEEDRQVKKDMKKREKETAKKTSKHCRIGGAAYEEVPIENEADHLDGNPVCVTIMKKRVSVCTGCSKKYMPHHKNVPLNLVFMYLCRRMRPDKEGKWFRGKTAMPAYFHIRDLACIRAEKEDATAAELYMTNETINSLEDGHIVRLQQLGYWEHILGNRARLM